MKGHIMQNLPLAHALIAFAAPDTRCSGGASCIAEIVTFRLVAGADPEAFVRAAEGMTPFLRSTGAARARTLSRDDSGLWTDHIVWRDMAAASDAAARIMQEPSSGPFMSMINPATVALRHATIRFAPALE
jgi:hypothetical protein